ncbi:hypothetical protein [uncultured Jannaschia sp.]|uniref:hypothetical protein n=1 Tax=uncultured Jannaschia sp. TaxID=293347 RepID=UPI00261C3D78|nr:hypothetical protein [uncultured Jannaschia sp.]
MFSTTTSFTTPTNNEFSIFSIHDGRNGCAPPLQLFVREDGRMYIASDIKTGPGESCIRGTIGGTSPARVKRDGTEQLLEVLVQFDGSGGFRSVVWLDGAVQIDGRYAPSQRPDAILSSRFYFKHGVYSKRVFTYTLRSTDMGVRRVRVN